MSFFHVGIRSNQLVPPLPDEIKDGQWLGVTVRSQGPGRKVLVYITLRVPFRLLLSLSTGNFLGLNNKESQFLLARPSFFFFYSLLSQY